MGVLVVMGAELACAFGQGGPVALLVEREEVVVGGLPVATVVDSEPLLNIPPFGLCMSEENPEVAAATAAALGVLTPMPCVPEVLAPWEPGSVSVLVGGVPALTNSSTCQCAWGGLIQIVAPGQTSTEVAG
ncbi:DUF4280 domain-containing protein [Kitasatospora sp. MAP5-34]|uniref:DUF4280 domain-containing protein n=1 Tax=Kitasatospora sp. MAP5-34 TaxID=3035102 RepID=UPI0024747428|nr:DUF4280 domain-containing protein [Kitasatospora sp. MAP5-34]MDH6577867.1 hypothetical protein [Kitasatospora sp. MAP5-34]